MATAPSPPFPRSPPWSFIDFLLADFNQDGIPDLFDYGTSSASQLYLGNGDGTFAAGLAVASSPSLLGATVAEMNHDGKPDIVGLTNATCLHIFSGNGDGTFTPHLHQHGPVRGRLPLRRRLEPGRRIRHRHHWWL